VSFGAVPADGRVTSGITGGVAAGGLTWRAGAECFGDVLRFGPDAAVCDGAAAGAATAGRCATGVAARCGCGTGAVARCGWVARTAAPAPAVLLAVVVAGADAGCVAAARSAGAWDPGLVAARPGDGGVTTEAGLAPSGASFGALRVGGAVVAGLLASPTACGHIMPSFIAGMSSANAEVAGSRTAPQTNTPAVRNRASRPRRLLALRSNGSVIDSPFVGA
jgi:hypothetical protein